MRIRTETGAGKHLVNLAGRFDAHEVKSFGLAMEPLLADLGAVIRINLANVVFVDSSALAALLKAHRSATAQGGDLVLVDVSDPVRVILEVTALSLVFKTEVSGSPATAVGDGG